MALVGGGRSAPPPPVRSGWGARAEGGGARGDPTSEAVLQVLGLSDTALVETREGGGLSEGLLLEGGLSDAGLSVGGLSEGGLSEGGLSEGGLSEAVGLQGGERRSDSNARIGDSGAERQGGLVTSSRPGRTSREGVAESNRAELL